MKPATYYLHFSDCIMENELENHKSRGRNASEGCLMKVELVADRETAGWGEVDAFRQYLRKRVNRTC